ncbi:MAG TPA: hypothetical protein VIW29_16530 [Polyangiaceae bacterium]
MLICLAMDRRRAFELGLIATALLLSLGGAAGCGGAPTRLVTVKSGTGTGPIQLEVKNLSDAAINNLFLAKSEQVGPELDDDSPQGQEVWGVDLLSGAIATGTRVPVPVAGPGRWDVRALDRDGRYQRIAGLKLEAGGRYILELNDSGWRVK